MNMNRPHFTLSILVLLLLFSGPNLLRAQIAPWYTEDDASVFPQIQVSNTGNSVIHIDDRQFRVSCWDGHTPGFHFDYDDGAITEEYELQTSLDTSVLDLAYDPDVIITPDSNLVVMVYQWQGRIFMETWKFNGTICTPDIPPTLISSGTAFCTFPNIDQANEVAGIVWEQDGRIKSRSLDLISFNLGPEVEFGTCIVGVKSMPDISVYSHGFDRIVNVVFINSNSAGKQLMMHRHHLTALEWGITPVCTPADTTTLKAFPYGPRSFQHPRIASTPYSVTTPHHKQDCEVVVTEIHPGLHTKVVGFNHTALAWGVGNYVETTLSEATPANLFDCGNFLPVVSYVACERIMVEWWHKELYYGPCLPTTGEHIIGRQLHLNGVPAYDNYSRLSWDVVPYSFYSTPSVSGRYISQFGGLKSIFSTYTKSATFKVRYKSSSCGITQMKASEAVSDGLEQDSNIEAFPNPFTDKLTISLTSEEQNHWRSVQILNVNGKLIHSWNQSQLNTEISELGKNGTELEWDSSEYPDGIYLIRLEDDRGVQVKKVAKMN